MPAGAYIQNFPCRISTASEFPQLRPAPPPLSLTPRAYTASLQGAREYQEDRVTVEGDLIAVHDGHGGSQAVDLLQQHVLEFARNADEAALPPMARLRRMYERAGARLEREASGAVSVTALMHAEGEDPDTVHFGYVGDAQGCVFSAHSGRVCVASVSALDTALQQAAAAEKPPIIEVSTCPAETEPHALRADDVVRWQTQVHFLDDGFFGIPCEFEEGCRTEREWRLQSILCVQARRAPAIETPREPLPLSSDALAVLQVAHYPTGHDCRFAQSVQPSRSLGDGRCTVMAHPEIWRMKLGPTLRPHVLLCSDGLLDGHAFADVDAACRFMVFPLRFMRESFYSHRQHHTRALIMDKKLPEDLSAPVGPDNQHQELFVHWRRCRTWKDAVALMALHLRHIRALTDFTRWLQACEESVAWFTLHHRFVAPVFPKSAVEAAAHLAVIMGSQDNVTLVVARLHTLAQKDKSLGDAPAV